MRIGPPRQSTLNRINTAVSLATQANNYRKVVKTWWTGRNTYTVSVSSREMIYVHVREWLNEIVPRTEQHNISFMFSNRLGDYLPVHDDEAIHVIELHGKKIKVEIQSAPSLSELIAEDMGGSLAKKDKKEQILFTVTSAEDQDMLIKELTEIRNRSISGPSRNYLWTIGNQGNWIARGYIPQRSIESVVLPNGQKERIVADIRNFLDNQDSYDQLGISYHRGYLLHGLPGTGKTSLAKALACYFGMDLYYLPLGSISSDTNLMTVFNTIAKNSILLLEDVDVFASMKDRHKDINLPERTFTLSGLLNVLDGVMTPPGLINILSTNDKNVLDPAIIRPGRVDVIEELTTLVEGQAEDIFRSFYGRYPSRSFHGVIGLTSAVIVNVLKSHMHDPEMAERAIVELERVKV